MSLLNVLGGAIKPVVGLFQSKEVTRQIKEQTEQIKIDSAVKQVAIEAQVKQDKIAAQGQLAVAKINAQAAQFQQKARAAEAIDDKDLAYDMRASEEAKFTLMDEVYRLAILGMVLFPMGFPAESKEAFKALEAMPYFLQILFFVSVMTLLGGVRILRMLINSKGGGIAGKIFKT